MSNNINNSQVSFNGAVHQVNRLSKKLSAGKTLTKIVDNEFAQVQAPINGELAKIREVNPECYHATLAKPAEIKKGGFLTYLSGSGRTETEAAKDLLNQIKEGATLVTDAYNGAARAEYFVKQGAHGLEIQKLNTVV